MNKRLRVSVAIVSFLAFAAVCFAASDGPRPSSSKGVNLAGQVSADARRFTTDDDTSWTVANPKSLTGFEKRYVTIKCRIVPEKRALIIISVETRSDNGPRFHDSAFRR
jgi:hypothetical protein